MTSHETKKNEKNLCLKHYHGFEHARAEDNLRRSIDVLLTEILQPATRTRLNIPRGVGVPIDKAIDAGRRKL